MLIRVRKRTDPRPGEITPEDVFLRRRELLRAALWAGGALAMGPALAAGSPGRTPGGAEGGSSRRLVAPRNPRFSTDEPLTDEEDATSYNNFYELGAGKKDPARNAHLLRTDPWSVRVEGAVHKPARLALEDLLRPHPLEERVYRFRCVEAWSMVVPWIGFPLRDLLRRFEPLGSARYVAFESILDPERLPGQRRPILAWPYREGLRIDEAMHPLTILAVGMYGRVLPNQNGAPLRLVVPWKYGFKSIKSIVTIRLQSEQPHTSWNDYAPREYGFYSNVNPDRPHPRWSQKRERRLGEWFRRPTLPFNGYADEVAHLYRGMDLLRWF